jgi:pimeloyl-ACP methyl ester carboxylesterase
MNGYWLALNEGTYYPFRQFAKEFPFMLNRFPTYQRAFRAFSGSSMIIWGIKDTAMDYRKLPVQFAKDLRIPSARTHFLEKASHFFQEDNHIELSILIDDFVSERI